MDKFLDFNFADTVHLGVLIDGQEVVPHSVGEIKIERDGTRDRLKPFAIECPVLIKKDDRIPDLGDVYWKSTRTHAEVELVEFSDGHDGNKVGRVLTLYECVLIYSVGEKRSDELAIAMDSVMVSPNGFTISRCSEGIDVRVYLETRKADWTKRRIMVKEVTAELEMVEGYNSGVAEREKMMRRSIEEYMNVPLPEWSRINLLDAWYLWSVYGGRAIKVIAESIWAENNRREKQESEDAG